MSSSGDSSVSYRCPQCHAKLTASADDAGQRRTCPRCGKVIKVPGTGSQARARPRGGDAADGRPVSETGGIASIPLVCPLCGTRMYATKAQIGQTMVCPDCLETVVVPERSPPKGPAERPVAEPESPPAATVESEEGPAESHEPDDAGEGDEYRLSDAVELPRHRSVSQALGELIDRHATPEGQSEGGDEERREPAASPAAQPPSSFLVKCPVCDTMLNATEDEIGTTMKCPDCFSSIQIKRPPPKRPRVNPVAESEDKEEFKLSDPVPLDIYRPTDKDAAPRTLGEEALRDARLAQAERERGGSDLPLSPLWTGVFDFLADAAVMLRIVLTGVLLAITAKLGCKAVILMGAGDPGSQFFGIVAGIAGLFLGAIAVSYASANFLNVLQESAEGGKKIINWPENSLAEWVTESFAFLMAVFFAVIPGMLGALTFRAIVMRPEIAWLIVGFSAYAFFPITQLSILESTSLTNPASKPIVESLRDQFLLWCTFYIMTFFVALPVAVALSLLRPGHPTLGFIAVGLFVSFAAILYARLLGRLAWACQMGPVLENQDEHDTGQDKSGGR